MLNLILKDVLIQKKYLLISVLYALFFAFCFQSNASMMFVMIPTMIPYLLILGACGFDDKNKSEIMLNSLPIDRTTLVIAKYLSSLFFIFMGILLTFVFTTLLNFLGFIHMNRLMNLEDILSITVGVLIICCVYFPFYFKFGYQKSRYFLIGMFCLFFSGGIFLANNVIKVPKNLISSLNSQPDWLIATFIAVIVAILFLISLLLSIKFYINKDL
ncbi:ABC-2 transporter permease [Clostridium sp. P21]|uniref:ABC-2 transporter permease n=1 Tax=Clostridium muellerianum TaxID=2716538 RepID=A0A7Y0EKL2_9CLOT|nr:ABC-2 transporter permease [Clostridium muellerianum]NMM64767.1 ABC-2 transporter permease [Clostridium muellerianum]